MATIEQDVAREIKAMIGDLNDKLRQAAGMGITCEGEVSKKRDPKTECAYSQFHIKLSRLL